MGVHRFVTNISNKIERYHQLFAQHKKISDKRRKKIIKNFTLTKAQEKEIISFFKENYGKRISTKWHRYYGAFTGKVNVEYFPENIYMTYVEPLFNPKKYADALCDKNLLKQLFGQVKDVVVPNTIISKTEGIFRNSTNEIVDESYVINCLYNYGMCFIKPSVDSSSGNGCYVLKLINGIDENSGRQLQEILKEYKENFTIQELIRCSDAISALHPASVNTFRIITYLLNGKMYHCPICMRIGTNNNSVDNAHAGGIFVGVTELGRLKKYAFTEYGNKYDIHPNSGIKFENYEIPNFDRIIDVAYRLHSQVPQLKIISWDLTIDSNGNVVLLEANIKYQGIWLMQMANGEGLFRENTAEILRIIKNK